MQQVIIDVREKYEFNKKHIPDSINLPLSSFRKRAPEVLDTIKNKKVIIMCLSGSRAMSALNKIKQMDNTNSNNYQVYPNGIIGWQRNGNQVITPPSKPMSIFKKIQIATGLIIISGIVFENLKHYL